MLVKLEGILLTKVLYRERDLIVNLLLRSGRKIGVILYGVRSSNAKKNRGFAGVVGVASVELGQMLKLEARKSKSRGSDGLFSANEWSVLWNHRYLRGNYRAFFLLCFYLEVLTKSAVEEEIWPYDGHRSSGQRQDEMLFAVASNAIFYLERCLRQEPSLERHKEIFLAKILYALGIAPNLKKCVFCGGDFIFDAEKFLLSFRREEGGFVGSCCYNQNFDFAKNLFLYRFLHDALILNYAQLIEQKTARKNVTDIVDVLFDYLCYHYQWWKSDFKSIKYQV
ncbi:MAG: hypothetical protein HQK53_08010 [Oligoflexia bacterium]|nr:hypothetical protein [Oligoflexia bacterium]